ncbi:Pimeloyl-ACP methyl ester carboxylesterase [Duganella sp. CF517]|nr:Pimeloyl-ACP methyl ester carboxylesterase [Duganella sp. CF517]
MSPSTHFPAIFHMLRAMLLACALAAPAAMADSKTYTVTAPDGVTLAVREAGDPHGAPLIFIHGLLGSTLNWEAQVADPRLQRYRLISYDMRGHGLSGKPAGAEAYSDGRRWAADLRAVITASRAARPVLVGWSLGGAVISNYLSAYGDGAIAGAVYVDGVIELKPEQIVAHPEVYRDLNAPDLKTHLDAVREFLRLCFHTQPAAPDFERLLANAAVASWDMQRAVQSMRVDLAGGLGKAEVPVLLIYGAQDALVKARPSIARAAEVNPRIRSKLYDASGHAPFIEEADRFNRDLAGFVDGLKR